VWQHGGKLEYADAIWVYWTRDLTRWNSDHKAVVLDRTNGNWSKHIIGLPSVVKAGSRLAILYDGNGSAKMPGGAKSHMDRDIGLAWLDLPLIAPADSADETAASPKITVASYYFGNCWNEWTEGSYLEPDTVNGLKYLEAVRAVFAKGK